MAQSSGGTEHELLSLSSDSWTDAQQPDQCILWTNPQGLNVGTPTVIQGFAEHISLPTSADAIDPIEEFSEEEMSFEKLAVA